MVSYETKDKILSQIIQGNKLIYSTLAFSRYKRCIWIGSKFFIISGDTIFLFLNNNDNINRYRFSKIDVSERFAISGIRTINTILDTSVSIQQNRIHPFIGIIGIDTF